MYGGYSKSIPVTTTCNTINGITVCKNETISLPFGDCEFPYITYRYFPNTKSIINLTITNNGSIDYINSCQSDVNSLFKNDLIYNRYINISCSELFNKDSVNFYLDSCIEWLSIWKNYHQTEFSSIKYKISQQYTD